MMRLFLQINNLRAEILFYKFTETLIKGVNFRELRILLNSRTGKILKFLIEKMFFTKTISRSKMAINKCFKLLAFKDYIEMIQPINMISLNIIFL